MAKVERYNSFEEMENAPKKISGRQSILGKKKLTTIEEFAALLRENAVSPTKKKQSSK